MLRGHEIHSNWENKDNVDKIVTTLNDKSFIPLITKHTRFPSVSQPGNLFCINQMWVNVLEHCQSGILLSDNSDYCPLFAFLFNNVVKKKPEKVKVTFRNFDEKCIIDEIDNILLNGYLIWILILVWSIFYLLLKVNIIDIFHYRLNFLSTKHLKYQ